MVNVRIEKMNGFSIIGQKKYITRLEQFAGFWKESHENGLINTLNIIRKKHGCPVTGGTHIGLSCTEKDPDNRDFDFFIAVEYPKEKKDGTALEVYSIQSYTWAIFSKQSTKIEALFDCEMFAFKEWLPSAGYKHDFGPEIEVYHENKIEFWLPVIKKE